MLCIMEHTAEEIKNSDHVRYSKKELHLYTYSSLKVERMRLIPRRKCKTSRIFFKEMKGTLQI